MNSTPQGAPARLLVIGADAAGMSAAHQALRTARTLGVELEVVALEASAHTSYSACGIPYVASGEVGEVTRLVARTAEQHRAAGIDLRTGVRVTRLDLASHTVETESLDGTRGTLAFDHVMVATGAAPVTPAWALHDGHLLDGVRHAKTLDDAAAWAAALEPGQRAVVAGGGYIGVEMAEAALRRGLQVTMLTRSRVLSSFSAETTARVAAALRAAGVDLREHSEVRGLAHEDGRVTGVVLDDATVAADHVVLAIGVVPATGFIDDETLLHGRRRALHPDAFGRIDAADQSGIAWSAGDCCEVIAESGHRTFAPLGTHANKAGRQAGENIVRSIAGLEPVARFPGALGTSITRFAHGDVHVEIARTGILDAQLSDAAADLAWDAVFLTTEGTTATGYMPEARPIAVRVGADRTTRRLLSVEIVGGQGAGKRIDTAAAVLHFGGTVDDLAWMDLAYAPPVATAWEIVQIAARRLAERL
ncbi:FAD-dependent oxidoreductase [Nocardioides yefusunii]|uniref:FAD-dependent oxidoreductase n=1 Tax=Nocardioides yefusunii TaxID=2500546 RepID=A0ABW1R130_9ACTN|nr:FAD-dependent oxidoreductase [Nocardioides yefusunii]